MGQAGLSAKRRGTAVAKLIVLTLVYALRAPRGQSQRPSRSRVETDCTGAHSGSSARNPIESLEAVRVQP